MRRSGGVNGRFRVARQVSGCMDTCTTLVTSCAPYRKDDVSRSVALGAELTLCSLSEEKQIRHSEVSTFFSVLRLEEKRGTHWVERKLADLRKIGVIFVDASCVCVPQKWCHFCACEIEGCSLGRKIVGHPKFLAMWIKLASIQEKWKFLPSCLLNFMKRTHAEFKDPQAKGVMKGMLILCDT